MTQKCKYISRDLAVLFITTLTYCTIKASGIESKVKHANSSSPAKPHASAAKSKNSAAGKYLIEKWQP